MSNGCSWNPADQFYSYDLYTFPKRELFPHERMTNKKGEIVRMPWQTARLENEYAALEYIATNTDIPVPEVVSFEKIDGSFQLVVDRVDAVSLNEIAENIGECQELHTTIVLPHLAGLRSNKTGNLNGVVIPPVRITSKDKRPCWPARAPMKSSSVI